MNNQPKIEAFNSFYQQGKDLYNAGDIMFIRIDAKGYGFNK